MYSAYMLDRTEPLEVGVTDLRASLAHWLDVARMHEVVITDRGRPVARLLPVDATPGLQALIETGAVTAPSRSPEPLAPPVTARGCVSDLIDRR
jgi:prevent-host-death family protein